MIVQVSLWGKSPFQVKAEGFQQKEVQKNQAWN